MAGGPPRCWSGNRGIRCGAGWGVPFAALRGYDEQIDSSNESVLGAGYRNDLFAEDENYIETGDVY